MLAWLAPQTKTIKLGAAIMQVPARPPAAAAMAGATIDELSGGRFIFGFGPSGPQVSEGWYGVEYPKPWGRTREYIEVVREIIAREGPLEHKGKHYTLPLEGAETTGQGKALKLNFHPLRNEIPVFVGAIGASRSRWRPRSATAGSRSSSSRRIEETWGEHLEAGFAKGGRARSDLEISPTVQVAIDGDLDAARAVVKAGLLLYLGGMGSQADQLLRRPHPPLRLRRRVAARSRAVPGRQARRGLRGDPRRARRRDRADRHRGRGRRAHARSSRPPASTG